MQTKTKFIIFIAIIIVLVGGYGLYTNLKPQGPGKLDAFTQCLKSSGAEFYGAFWCPHCNEQKDEFGSSKRYLPYIECSNPDNTQTQICIDKKIEGYPTWIFADGTSLSGKQSLEILAEKTKCVLPQ